MRQDGHVRYTACQNARLKAPSGTLKYTKPRIPHINGTNAPRMKAATINRHCDLDTTFERIRSVSVDRSVDICDAPNAPVERHVAALSGPELIYRESSTPP